MIQVITRAGWGARPPDSIVTVPARERSEFIVHYSAGPPSQSIRAIQDYHMDTKGWSDIGYNFLVRGGVLYQGRGWDRQGSHTVGHNRSGIAVCFVGRDGDATEHDRRAIRELYVEAVARFGSLRRYGHRDLDSTTCPGDALHTWVHRGMPLATPPPAPPARQEEEDDMKIHVQIGDDTSVHPAVILTDGLWWKWVQYPDVRRFDEAQFRINPKTVIVHEADFIAACGAPVPGLPIPPGFEHLVRASAGYMLSRADTSAGPATAGDTPEQAGSGPAAADGSTVPA